MAWLLTVHRTFGLTYGTASYIFTTAGVDDMESDIKINVKLEDDANVDRSSRRQEFKRAIQPIGKPECTRNRNDLLSNNFMQADGLTMLNAPTGNIVNTKKKLPMGNSDRWLLFCN